MAHLIYSAYFKDEASEKKMNNNHLKQQKSLKNGNKLT